MHYGETRSSPKAARIDIGMPKNIPQKRKADSEISWLRNRRRAVSQGASSVKRRICLDSCSESEEDLAYFSEKHSKEKRFNQDKALKKKVAALDKGTLFEEEKTEEFLAQAAEANAKQAKVDKKRVRAEKKMQIDLTGGKLIPKEQMRGWTVHVEKGVLEKHGLALDKAFAEHGMVRTDARSNTKARYVQLVHDVASALSSVIPMLAHVIAGALWKGGVPACVHVCLLTSYMQDNLPKREH